MNSRRATRERAAASVFEINIRAIPRQRFRSICFDYFVPAELANWSVHVKIPVEPNPMFRGVGNRGVEHQADDRLAADISDADAYTGRIESNKLNRTTRGRSGPGT